jgi:uncharacterized protein YecE (DUF72 family)
MQWQDTCVRYGIDMRRREIHIGTSGWSYKHWKGRFYPDGLPSSDQFKYLRKYFDTVEINNSFYRLPSAAAFENWKKSSFPGFLFAVKASRYITHMKKLLDGPKSTKRFFNHANHLGSKLGPILFQLPPGWKCNPERLSAFVDHLPKRHHYAFEFRNPTWYNERVYAILKKRNCAFCIYELGGHRSPEVITANFVYVRLHGPEAKYSGNYSDTILGNLAKKIKQWKDQGLAVYVYFDNDVNAYAAFNALKLKEMVHA